MKNRLITVLLITIAFGPGIELSAQEDLSVKTAFIGNRYYLVADSWSDLPLDEVNREDMNSKKYGGRFYPMLAHNSTTTIEKRLSIANQQMEIWFDLSNTSDKTWKLQEVTLDIVRQYDLNTQKVESGTWRNYKSRLNAYSPKFYLKKGETDDIIVKPTKTVLVYPDGTESDNRFSLKVFNDRSMPVEGLIYEFKIVVTLVDTKSTRRKRRVTSDKSYFLAFEK